MLIGNVGKEPEVRYYAADQPVAQFSLATTERGYTLANGTQVPDHTDWHNIVTWNRLAKIVEKYVHKGDKLYIEGRIRYRKYDNAKGQRCSTTEIWAESMELLGQRQQATNSNPSNVSSGNSQSSTYAQQGGGEKLPF